MAVDKSKIDALLGLNERKWQNTDPATGKVGIAFSFRTQAPNTPEIKNFVTFNLYGSIPRRSAA